MRIALAQIDMRLGDIEGVCARIEEQERLAREQGASLLAVPAPLFSGVLPGSLVDSSAYVRDVLRALSDLASRIETLCLVPVAVSFHGVPFFEVMMLKEGRVVPMRASLAAHRGSIDAELWAPPVFDVEGVRVGVTFDAARDVEHLPSGCDLVLFFQVNGFDMSCPETAAVASVREGGFRDVVGASSMWLACMAPVGSFDEAVYTGGSFVMDGMGRVVCMAPCFEEGLCVCEVRRGLSVPTVEDVELPQFSSAEWVWEALRLYVRDTARALGKGRAALLLSGDMPSSLAAVLAVDALGSRNVTGVLVERADIFTPAQEAVERDRLDAVRRLAGNLHIELVEAQPPSMGVLLSVDAPSAPAPELSDAAEQLVLADVARRRSAARICSLTKTDYALAGSSAPLACMGDMAPFGDVYLTYLEHLARHRNGRSAAVPGALVGGAAVERRMRQVLARVNRSCQELPVYAEKVARLLEGLDASTVDGVLAGHIDRNQGVEDVECAGASREAVQLLLMQVRRGEFARRALPTAPVVSMRSFAERAWPQSLAWSDLGGAFELEGGVQLTLEAFARAEVERFEENAPDVHARAREQVMGLLGELFGLSEEQMSELASEEGQQRVQEGMERFEQELRRALGAAASSGMSGMPGITGAPSFFSLN